MKFEVFIYENFPFEANRRFDFEKKIIHVSISKFNFKAEKIYMLIVRNVLFFCWTLLGTLSNMKIKTVSNMKIKTDSNKKIKTVSNMEIKNICRKLLKKYFFITAVLFFNLFNIEESIFFAYVSEESNKNH